MLNNRGLLLPKINLLLIIILTCNKVLDFGYY